MKLHVLRSTAKVVFIRTFFLETKLELDENDYKTLETFGLSDVSVAMSGEGASSAITAKSLKAGMVFKFPTPVDAEVFIEKLRDASVAVKTLLNLAERYRDAQRDIIEIAEATTEVGDVKT